nr:MAG TPA: protein of unknown function (DUF4519) [Caudoviricetes sp.]
MWTNAVGGKEVNQMLYDTVIPAIGFLVIVFAIYTYGRNT